MDIKELQIAIVGGGPAGLTLARLLQRKGGKHVNVYERDFGRNARVQGTSLDLHTDAGLLALEMAGLTDAFKAAYRPLAGLLRITDKAAKLHVDEHAQPITKEQTEGFGHEHFRPEIDRGPLRDLLLDSLEPDTVVWDRHVVALEPSGNGWKLEFQNGDTALADLVIAADGSGSKIRPFITPIKADYTGVMVLEGIVEDFAANAPRVHDLVRQAKLWVLDDSKILMFSGKGDGSCYFGLGFKANENWVKTCGLDFKNPAQLLEWFHSECAGWSEVWDELFTNQHSTYTLRKILCVPMEQSWEAKPNLTMIGDAAHVMPPFAGEGVNVAMLDALKLSEFLTDPNMPDLSSSIAAFETEMRERAKPSMKESLANTEMFHSPAALEAMTEMFGELR